MSELEDIQMLRDLLAAHGKLLRTTVPLSKPGDHWNHDSEGYFWMTQEAWDALPEISRLGKQISQLQRKLDILSPAIPGLRWREEAGGLWRCQCGMTIGYLDNKSDTHVEERLRRYKGEKAKHELRVQIEKHAGQPRRTLNLKQVNFYLMPQPFMSEIRGRCKKCNSRHDISFSWLTKVWRVSPSDMVKDWEYTFRTEGC